MTSQCIYRHTNLNAKNWRSLGSFYEKVFGLKPVGPERDLHGEWFDRVTGVKGAHVRGQHYELPGYQNGGPTFEIFTYNIHGNEGPSPINGFGFAHVAFEVDDVDEVYRILINEGGSACGEKVERYYDTLDKTLHIIYARDPEGNIIEIMKWV